MMPERSSRSETREKKRISDREIRVFRAFLQTAARTAEYDARFGSSVGPRHCAVLFRNCVGIVRGIVFISDQLNT